VKTQIITLESHDDLISVRDRMSWAKTPRILLVAPKFESIVLRQVDLKILQRHAVSLGAQLGIVTRVRRIRQDAGSLGIPVFESPGAAQREAWVRPRRRRFPRRPPAKDLRVRRDQLPAGREAEGELWRARPFARIGFFSAGVLSVFAIVSVFIPRAQVVLQPVVKTQSVVLPVTASPSIASVFITGSIPAREKSVVVEGEQTVVVTGEGAIPQSKATGFVEFRNLTQTAQSIPIGTIVSAGEVRFETTGEATVDAGVGNKIEVAVRALAGGLAGNVDAESINLIEGRLGLLLSVKNLELITGGRELASVQASEDDRARAKKLLMEFLDEEARTTLLDGTGPGEVLFEKTIAVSQILLEEYDPPAGAASTKLTLSMQVEYSARYASAADLTALASLALNASLPTGFFPASDSVTLEPVTVPALADDGSARWTMRAERAIVQSVDERLVTQLVFGQSTRAAQIRMDEFLPAESAPKIVMSPSWWAWIPILPFRIEVVTE
jgi:hypothetical protein